MKLALLASLLPLVALAADPAPSAAPAQAVVANPVKEADLTTVTLTPAAATRLRLATVPVEKKAVPFERLYGGEVTLPMAIGEATNSLTALAPPQNAAEMLKLAELQAAADGELSQARVKRDSTRLTLDRSEKLRANQTGSDRSVEEARAAHDLAQAAFEQATVRRALLGPGFATSADGRRWWVRVAIFAADASTLDPQAPAAITPPGAKAALPARRIAAAPPTANAAAVTVDWYFEVEDPERRLRPGERVQVHLPVAGSKEERLTAPWAGVLHDIHGGQWVYEMTAPTTFVRRRVQVARVAGSVAVLATGPAAGAKIVTDGAAELFGIEFGPGK